MEKRNLNMSSLLNNLGYGYAGLNLYLALLKKCNISLWPISMTEYQVLQSIPEKHRPDILGGFNNRRVFDYSAPHFRVAQQFDMAPRIGNTTHNGLTFFELSKLEDFDLHSLGCLDRIFVSSRWAEGVLTNQGIEKFRIKVVPMGVDTSLFSPMEVDKSYRLGGDATTFLTIGKYEVRKGHDVLCAAFNKAFSVTDDVHLVVNCYNPFYTPSENEDWASMFKRSKLGDKITVIKLRLTSQEDVAKLMNSVDAGVFPARAEGWNMSLLEMMACGKPVITTNYSAHTEYCNQENAYLIEPEGLEPAYDDKWFHGQGEWMRFGPSQFNQLVEHLRTIHKIKQTGGSMVNQAGLDTANKLSWDVSAGKIVEGLFNE
jgi:glycosyltransferase involved in cell wall biosynthesis